LVAKEYLEYLRQRSEGLVLKIQQEVDRQFYPSGPNQLNLISQLQARVQDKIRVMQASPGDHTDEQEDYLRAMDQQLEAEVWQMLVQALRRTLTDIQAVVESLWDTLGDSAQGWCYTLDQAGDTFAKAYNQDESRRLEWTHMRLRTYLPTPGGEAEDALFAEVADPHLDSFFDQASWHIAISPEAKGAERYGLVFEYPGVGAKERAAVRMRTVLGEQIEASPFTPDRIAAWAEAQLKGSLESRTIWDIMEMDFAHDWLPKRGRTLQALSTAERTASSSNM